MRLLGAGGTLRVEGATVHWLRPIPPFEGVDAVLTFGKEEIGVAVRSGHQAGTAIRASEGRLRITDLGGTERLVLDVRLAGPFADTLEVLKHPRLRLFERKPLDLREPSGTLDGTLSIAFPLIADLPVERMQLSANAKLTNGRIAGLVAGQPLERANLDLSVDLTGLRVSGQANLGPVPSRVQAELDFRGGPPTQVTERVRAEGRADATAFTAFGVDAEDWVRGPVSVVANVERRRNGEGRVALRGDLREAQIDLGPLAYIKRPGTAGTGEGTLRLQGESLRAMEGVRVEAPDLLFRGALTFGARERVTRVDIAEARIGESRAAGNIVLPPEPRGPWRIALRGPMADLRPMIGRATDRPSGQQRGQERNGPPLLLDLGFERVVLGDQRSAGPVTATVGFDGTGSLRDMRASGRSGGGPFDMAIAPRGAGRALEVASNDAGAVLRGMGLFDDMMGGQIRVAGAWSGAAFASDLTAVAEVQEFSLRNAPSVGKFLQALTIYGIADAARGPGLAFSRLYAPFTLTEEALSFADAQAFSSSLGITARGRILRRSDTMEVQGTVVPAYMFNSMLGRLPVIGRLFSAEAGGGLFAVTFRATGPVADPNVMVNPLSALTPGALRGLFSAMERPDPPAAR
ncbi:AsmA-like C-terminal region-containing protein [Roseomonas sp. CCTCC AB2023176]|uniref:YhdP family protein n=1 Tax=Roseomonas sp. CCTCC AB2023176 TaxID=3342640 RepID=UPI0035D694C0